MTGFDILPDGSPPEEPLSSATAAYQNIPAPFGQFLGEQVGTTIGQIGRVAEQGAFEGAGWLPRLLYGMGAAETGGAAPPAGSMPSPMLGPDEYNSRYAPIGNDGKPVSLGSEPMPEGVAKLVGEARRAEIERENVTARFENAHSWPLNFAAGTLGYMLDPLRAATAFVPGLGEEALLARLGTGFAARTAARLAAGATAGAAAQLPVSALQYGLGQEEASDYGLRDAFRDLAFGAAGNAIFHAGFGALGDLLGRHTAATPIVEAPAPEQHAAMSSAVAELADGRPVEVGSFIEPTTPDQVTTQQRALYTDGFAPGVPGPELRQTTADIWAPEEPPTEVAGEQKEPEEKKEGAPLIVDLGGMGNAMTANLYRGLFDALKKGSDVFAGVRDPIIARAKPFFEQGILHSPENLRALVQANYNPDLAGLVSAETAAVPTGETAAKPLAEVDPELAVANERAAMLEGQLLPEEREEIANAQGMMVGAEAKASAIEEAAQCLKEAGL